ncbi:hypothetical protein BDV06DRAFT_199330 [Aspergillus oleicola]
MTRVPRLPTRPWELSTRFHSRSGSRAHNLILRRAMARRRTRAVRRRNSHGSQGTHVGQTACLLCRQKAETGSPILDHMLKQHTVHEPKYCCSICVECPRPEVWFHRDCYFLLESTYKDQRRPAAKQFKDLGDVLKCSHLQDGSDRLSVSVREGLVSPWAARLHDKAFSQGLLKRFPAEIQLAIAELIGSPWYLIVLGETRRLLEELSNIDEEPQSAQIRLAGAVYVSWITYHGHSYISRISNTPFKTLESSDQQCLKVPPSVQQVILSTDFIGVRQMQFVDQDSKVTSDGSPRYEFIDIPGPSSELNSLFLRSLGTREGRPANRIWNVVNPPELQPWNLYSIQESYQQADHLDCVELCPELKGLVVCCSTEGILGIHGFVKPSSAFRSFVRLMDQKVPGLRKQWIFFPVNAGEVFENAWVRQFEGSYSAGAQHLLVIQTSLGRVVTFGPQYTDSLRHKYKFRPLRKEGDGALSAIVHDGSNPARETLHTIAVTCNPDIPSKNCNQEPPEPFPSYTPPSLYDWSRQKFSRLNLWFLSKAPLQDVLSIRVCRDQEQDHFPYTGMILRYADNHLESVGQVRMDRKISPEIRCPIQIQHCYNIGEHKQYIGGISTSEKGNDQWEEIPQRGTLVWWFGPLGDQVSVFDD